ncbi:ATP-binding protein [Caldinitratiruptor microaerophilus]|uniref:Molecular chaperone HtpG n=1 Tax=Caldinitratiruptor microaerophilus TaxID=671077 RepID=A0AA35CPK8_9FIRM|nr:ATP-binding protein [Caldinitratiruptor microaerophilus]BDG61496.1 hypothetical protein caldi_25860 [Caldinitratiruptor microaerophilus]
MSEPETEILRFELSSHEVIELLAGNNIYPDPRRVVVRELLQNAVDACRLRRAVTSGYEPEVSLEWEPGRLVVADNGAGMSEAIVRDFFLRVGRSYYSSAAFREQYGPLGFSPIARFGIGALSAFLVARRLTVETRHHLPGSDPVRLEIEGLHSTIRKTACRPDLPVGTRLELDLMDGVEYPDLEQVVRHWARHLEFPIRVRAGTAETVIPADDGSGFRLRLLDPAHYLLRDPARRHQLRSRRVEFDGDGVRGFIEYGYLEVPGRLVAAGVGEARAVAEFDPGRLPRAVSLDGIYVGDRLPAFLGGPAVAFDLNLSSRELRLQLRLARTEFVEDEAYRRLVRRLDERLADDLLDLLRSCRLTPVQTGDTLGTLLDVPHLGRHAAATGSDAVWSRLAGLPVYPLRRGGERALVPWAEVLRHPEVARVPVGEDRVAWPESGAHLADDFWWDRHFRLTRAAGSGLPFYTSLDSHPVMDALLERDYRPVRVVVDTRAGVSYAVHGRGAPEPRRLGGLSVLPFDGAGPETLLTYVDGWVLNAAHPLVRQLMDELPGSPLRGRGEKALRDLTVQLGTLPDRDTAEGALRRLRDDLGLEVSPGLPGHDTSEFWSGVWEHFLLTGAGG